MHSLDLDRLPQLQLVDLENRFTEEEVCVCGGGDQIPRLDKAPEPDGFIAHFFQAGWEIIKADIMCVSDTF
jgi:hypothetical protein